MSMCAVSEDVLFFAFRYALGRRTPAVAEVAETIKMNISNISVASCRQMIKEINEEKAATRLGMEIDAQEWMALCELRGKKVNGNR